MIMMVNVIDGGIIRIVVADLGQTSTVLELSRSSSGSKRAPAVSEARGNNEVNF
jgi:hypothetical protein